MKDIPNKVEDSNISSNKYEYYFKKYVKQKNQILSYDKDNLINKNNIENLICPICFFVLKDPISCTNKENAHSFCKECIKKLFIVDYKCPTCRLNFE